MVAVFVGIMFETKDLLIMLSIMQLTCCVALSLYSCCVKKEFTRIWSHIFVGMMLLCSVGVCIALHPKHFVFFLVSGLGVAVWVTFVMHNTMALIKEVKSTESYYAALIVQTDVAMLIK